MHEPRTALDVPTDIAFYSSVISILDRLRLDILAGKYQDPHLGHLYNASRPCPDFEHTLSNDFPTTFDPLTQQNRYQLIRDISEPAIVALRKLLGGSWEQGGTFWYPAHNGWMDWHAHPDYKRHELRLYFVWCAEANKSRFLWSQDDGKTIYSPYEPSGWSINVFRVGDRKHLFWHAVDCGGIDRISFGFRPGPGKPSSQHILTQETALFRTPVKDL